MKKLLQLLALTLVIAMVIILPTHRAIDSAPQQLATKVSNKVNNQLAEATNSLPLTSASPAWGNSGAIMMSLAAQVAANRNPAGQPLAAQQKKYLRPEFGDLVDRVQINYDAKLLDRWSNGEKEVHVGAVDSAAQTFCDRIYLRASYLPQDTAQLVLLAHELTHYQQCIQQGSLQKFGTQYFAAYQAAHQNYAANQFEKAARTQEQKFIKTLCHQLDCQQPRGRYYPNYRGTKLKLPVKIKI
jgi:Domain of unknown function (DUF4157)